MEKKTKNERRFDVTLGYSITVRDVSAFYKIQIAEVRVVQSPATLWKRCVNAPCGGDYFEHAQRQRHGLAFATRARCERLRCSTLSSISKA